MRYLVLYSHPESGWSMVKFSSMVNMALKDEKNFSHLAPYAIFSSRIRNRLLKQYSVFFEKKIVFPVQIFIAVLTKKPDRFLICDQSDAHLRFLVPFLDSIIFCHDLFAVNSMLNKDKISKQSMRIRIELKINLFFLRKGKRYISVSESTKKSILNVISNAKVAIIPPTVLREKNPIIFNRFDFPFCVLPMNDHWRKDRLGGIKVFCKIAEHMAEKLKLIIVGSPLTQTEMNFLREANRLDSVEMLNHISEMEIQSLYQNCEFVIFTSKFEGFGLPIIEANSFSKLVIYSNIETLREVGQEVNYCLTQGVEDTDWLHAIQFLKSEINRKSALKYFEENFTFELFQQRIRRELGK